MPRLLDRPTRVRIPAGFGGRVRAGRSTRGLSRADLAAALGVPAVTVASWESGAVFSISPGMLDTLATTLEVEPAWLLTRPISTE